MDGMHDLGGKERFGPIDVNEREVPFHSPWEGRVWAIVMLTRLRGGSLDWWRHVRELIEPTDYLTRRYFDQWLQTQTAALIDAGVLTLDEVVSGKAASSPNVRPPLMQRRDVVAQFASMATSFSREINSPPVFQPGDSVRARLMSAPGHTRLPAYVRGHVGVIHAHHGAHIFPDASATGEERAEHLYSVAFKASALWPEASKRTDQIFLDLWESYLEQASNSNHTST
jgi:nitrile hydratase